MNQIFKNSIDLLTARFFNVVSQLGIVVLISRRLGPDVFGEFSFLNAVILTGIVIANFGLDTFIVREVSRDHAKGNSLLSASLQFKLFTSMIVMGTIFILFRYLLNTQDISNILMLFSVTICLNSLSHSLWFYCDAFNRFKVHSFLWALSNLIKLFFVWMFLALNNDLYIVIYAIILSEIIILLLSITTIKLKFNIKPVKIHLSEFWMLFRKSYPIALIFILGALYFRIDLIMLKLLATKTSIGLYAASFRVVEFISIIPGTMFIAAFPNLSKSYIHDHNTFYSNANKAILMIGLVASVITLVVYFLSSAIIHTLYGPRYLEAGDCLRILSFAIFLLFLNGYFAYFHLARNNENLIVFILFTSTLFKILLNYFLIPKYNYMGSALSVVISEFLIFIFYCIPFTMALYQRRNGALLR